MNLKIPLLLWSILRWWNKRISWVIWVPIKASAGFYLWSLQRALSLPSFSQVSSMERHLQSHWSPGVHSPEPSASKLLLRTELSTWGISKGQPARGTACEINFFYKKSSHLSTLRFYCLCCLQNPYSKLYSFYPPTQCFLGTSPGDSSKAYFLLSWNQANAGPEFHFWESPVRQSWGEENENACGVWRESATRKMRFDVLI